MSLCLCLFRINAISTKNQTHTEAQKHAREPLTYNSSTACRALLDKHWLSRGGEHKARWMQQWRAEGFVAE